MNPSILITPNAKEAGKLYSIIPTDGAGDLDVVRATTATYVGSDGLIKTALANEPRIDYTNGSCPSILVEPQRTNLVNYSEEFDNVYWAKGGVTIESNSILSPSGNLTADKVTAGISGNRDIQKSISLLNGSFSVFAKKGSSDIVRLVTLGSFANVSFNLTDGTYIINSGTGFTASIEQIGTDGWYRCTINNIANITQVRIYPGVDNSYLYIWGAQLEVGSNATSYIPTVASSVTRNADVISKNNLKDFGLIGTSGSWFFELKNNIATNFDSNVQSMSISDNGIGTNNAINVIGFPLTIRTRQSGVVSNVYTTSASDSPIKVAITWNLTNINYYVNGVKVLNNGLFNSSLINTLHFGSNNGTRNINNMALFPTQLTDEQCIALTTL